MQQAGTCDYCGDVQQRLITCEICGAKVGPDHKRDTGCYVCQSGRTVDAGRDSEVQDIDRT